MNVSFRNLLIAAILPVIISEYSSRLPTSNHLWETKFTAIKLVISRLFHFFPSPFLHSSDFIESGMLLKLQLCIPVS